jgi:hypothetical protein
MTLQDNLSKQIINCSVKEIVTDEYKTTYWMDSKSCNVCLKSEFDSECTDYKVSSVSVYKSGKVQVWARYRTRRENWTMGSQCVDVSILEY